MSGLDVEKEVTLGHVEVLTEDEKVLGGTITQPRYDDEETSRILRKIDYRLLPLLTFLYGLAFLDRGNIGNARVAGMDTELGLSSTQYNICLMSFFFTYSLFEVPSNIVLKYIKPSTWIATIMALWGIVTTCQGLIHSYHHLIVTRLLLGLTEAGMGPGCAYIFTLWYCRFDLQTRIAIYTSSTCIAGSFSGLLAYGIQNMDGSAGLSGWRWIFILEGIFTVCVASTLHWILPDSPEEASFFTPGEKAFIKLRLESDAGTNSGRVTNTEKFQWKFARMAFMDWKIWVASMIQWSLGVSLYSFSFTLPTIIYRLGYSAANAQLLTIPVYFVGACCLIGFSRVSDIRQKRWIFVVIPASISLVALVGLISIPHPRLPGLAYFLLFIFPSGMYLAIAAILSWVMNNIAPSSKRAVGTALYLGFGNIGAIVGCNIFITEQAPHYWTGYGVCAGFMVVAITCAIILRFGYARINKQRDRLDEDEIRAKYTDAELLDLGDASPLYRYVT